LRLTPAVHAADPRYAMLGLQVDEVLYEPGGCERCSGTGYRGRTGVFEVLAMTEAIRRLVGSYTDASTINQAAIDLGMTTMFADALAKCRAGVTSAAEILRVTTVG
jgi:general secretion pathway protein E